MLLIITTLLSLFCSVAHADIFVDHEKDPIPVIEVNVAFPKGYASNDSVLSGAATLLPGILKAGTSTLDRKAYDEALGDFAASVDFSVGNLFSNWSLKFPYFEERDYSPLIKVLSENWNSPRFTQKEFNKLIAKSKAAALSSLNDDYSIMNSASRSLVSIKDFKLKTFMFEDFDLITLNHFKKVLASKYHSKQDLWAGMVGPDKAKDLVAKILKSTFKKQGKIHFKRNYQVLKKQKAEVTLADYKASKRLLIVHKKGRQQNVMSYFSLAPKAFDLDRWQTTFDFARFVTIDLGFESYLWDQIREKNGLAYSVHGQSPFFYRREVAGFTTNPLSTKIEKAFALIANKLLPNTYFKSSYITELDKKLWLSRWQSFENRKIISKSTANGRLGQRRSVALGLNSQNQLKTLKMPSQSQASQFLKKHSQTSLKLITVVGDESKIRPLAKKYFPDFKILKLGYKDILSRKSYVKLRP